MKLTKAKAPQFLSGAPVRNPPLWAVLKVSRSVAGFAIRFRWHRWKGMAMRITGAAVMVLVAATGARAGAAVAGRQLSICMESVASNTAIQSEARMVASGVVGASDDTIFVCADNQRLCDKQTSASFRRHQ